MGRVAKYTVEQLKAINAEMLANKWSVKDAAEKNSVYKFERWETLNMALRRNGLPTNVKKMAVSA